MYRVLTKRVSTIKWSLAVCISVVLFIVFTGRGYRPREFMNGFHHKGRSSSFSEKIEKSKDTDQVAPLLTPISNGEKIFEEQSLVTSTRNRKEQGVFQLRPSGTAREKSMFGENYGEIFMEQRSRTSPLTSFYDMDKQGIFKLLQTGNSSMTSTNNSRNKKVTSKQLPINTSPLTSIHGKNTYNRSKHLRPRNFFVTPMQANNKKKILNSMMTSQNWSPSLTSLNGSDRVTVVSSYFNIGSFSKGSSGVVFTTDTYRRWMTSFALIDNPLIVYLDSDEEVDLLKRIRRNFPENMTRIIKVNRSKLWSFGLKERIAKVFARDAYPRHLPNTVVPEYSMAMHAKYEFVQRTIMDNPFNTRYVCWLDVGLFRALVTSDLAVNMSTRYTFSLTIPPEFNSTSVAYTEVYPRNPRLTIKHIIKGNLVWVCGCYFIGRMDIMLRWTIEYMSGVEDMLDINEMSTDQQVIYWIFNRGKSETSIQAYKSDGWLDYWFYLGYLSRKYTNR